MCCAGPRSAPTTQATGVASPYTTSSG
jgi:hypothetical protein